MSTGGSEPEAVRLVVDGREIMLPGRQAEALRLFGHGRLIKQIGPAVGVADITVKTYLRAARVALGARDNRHAAEMLLQHESGGYSEGIYTPGHLEAELPPLNSVISPPDAASISTTGTSGVIDLLRDGRAPLRHESLQGPRASGWRRFFLRPKGQKENDLAPLERIESSLILTIALGTCGALVIIATLWLTDFLVNASNGPV